MSSPPVKYLRYFDFTTYATNNPEKPLPGASVDQEYNRIKSTTDQTIDRLALIQRDDGHLIDGAITTSSLADGAVTTPKLADHAVTSIKIADLAVTNGQIGNQSVDERIINNNAIWTQHILDLQVTTSKLADGAVTQIKIAANSITNIHLIDGCVTTTKIGDLQVTTPKLADQSVTTPKIGLAAVGYPQLQPNAVNSIILAPNAVGTAHIIDLSVTTAKLADGAVTVAKIADAAVTSLKLAPSLALTGIPTAPTALVGTSTNQLATTQFVNASLSSAGSITEAPNDGKLYGRQALGWQLGVRLAGDTMTGLLLLSADPAAALGAATKQYVDAAALTLATGKVAKAGDTMTGNLGVGRPPEAWAATYHGVMVGATTSLVGDGGGSALLASNLFYDGANWKYNSANGGSVYVMGAGQHQWYTAPGGAAGANAVNTEVMRLDVTGKLGLGMTPVQFFDARLDQNSGTVMRLTNAANGALTYAALQLQNSAGSSAVLRIHSSAFTPSGVLFADSAALLGSGANGLSILTVSNSPLFFGINNLLVGKWATSGAFQVLPSGVTGALFSNNVSSDDSAGMYVIAGTNLQLCNKNGTGWTYSSTRDLKRDFTPYPDDPFAVIAAHEVSLFRRKDADDDAPFQLGLYFEDAKEFFPYAAVETPAHDVMDGSTGKLVHSGVFKGITITNYIPLLMRAMQLVDQRLKAGGL